jgi:outer membrane protein OmpA-like peptidoglycan-associated protein
MTHHRALIPVSLILAAAVTLSLPGVADDATAPDAATLIRALKPKVKTRSLDLGAMAADRERSEKRKQIVEMVKSKTTRGLTLTTEERSNLSSVLSDQPSVDLEIYFDYDSAAITPQAKPTLTSLGQALQAKELKGQSFLVGGHTDATGTDQYNQQLSERRAAAVKKYLMENYGVSDVSLVATGFGKEQLKVPKDPLAAQNRRVQVVNVGE